MRAVGLTAALETGACEGCGACLQKLCSTDVVAASHDQPSYNRFGRPEASSRRRCGATVPFTRPGTRQGVLEAVVARSWHPAVFIRYSSATHGDSRCTVGVSKTAWKECMDRIKDAFENGARRIISEARH